ncbi:MAG: CDP-glycerol glycerophosphotransferase family protein [Bacteroidales bacterium]|nr:CDP-glycerol glycerophosphotransferase family protein [Bacteroidales bacterium]
MREKIITFFKTHPSIIRTIWSIARRILKLFVNISKQQNTIIFCSFGGRSFNDSSKAIYDEICRREEFKEWRLIWAFVEPNKFNIPRGEKVKVDTIAFFKSLITSKVWVSNSGMDRGIDLITDKILRVETWHGTPLKKIGGEENQNTFGSKPEEYKGSIDTSAIRCAQSEFDRKIFSRVFHASMDSIILSDLPRNDELFTYNIDKLNEIRNYLGVTEKKKVILYTPTYREYLINESSQNFIAPPMDLKKWERELGNEYVLLVRTHYAVSVALCIENNNFVKDVSSYPSLNDLYAISDMMISDYSSTYFDYAILNRPMLCFAYDKEEYEKKRGVYLDMEKELPCKVCKHEDEVISEILTMDVDTATEASKKFHNKYAPYAGQASKMVVDAILKKLK